MNEIENLKQDIIKTQKIVKKNQFELKELIDAGMVDDFEEVLENNPNYFYEQIQKLNNVPEQQEQPKQKHKNLFKKFIDYITHNM